VIGAVVPTCNRRDNLEVLLASLTAQTCDEFALVVADDGSVDGTRDMVENLARTAKWRDRLRWVGCGPDLGVRTGRARNIGAANIPAAAELIVMLDTDLVMAPTAMELFATAHRRHPDTVLFGTVQWLPPLDKAEVLDAVKSDALPALREQVPRTAPVRVEGTFTGPELRTDLVTGAAEPVPLRPGWALPLNSGWPVATYWAAGGFDETMQGYGYQDMNMGAHAARAGAQCVASPEIWALHMWHPKPARAMWENQHNLDRYLRTHGDYLRATATDDELEVDVDWSLHLHYHADRGGTVVRSGGQLWAISRSGRDRLALPDPGWLAQLGHTDFAVSPMPRDQLALRIHRGTATA
jgi:glycosyltransferase involved in cell wall biosynthesis